MWHCARAGAHGPIACTGAWGARAQGVHVRAGGQGRVALSFKRKAALSSAL